MPGLFARLDPVTLVDAVRLQEHTRRQSIADLIKLIWLGTRRRDIPPHELSSVPLHIVRSGLSRRCGAPERARSDGAGTREPTLVGSIHLGSSLERGVEINVKLAKSLLLVSAATMIAVGGSDRRPIFP